MGILCKFSFYYIVLLNRTVFLIVWGKPNTQHPIPYTLNSKASQFCIIFLTSLRSELAMRLWRFWWQTLVLSTQYNPPQFVEVVMLMLAIILLGFWSLTGDLPYLVLCLSYVVGSSTSMLVRLAIAPQTRFHVTQVIAVVLILISLYTLIDLMLSVAQQF